MIIEPKRCVPFLLLSAFTLLAGPAPSAEGTKRTVLNRVVAVVDEECITELELERRLGPARKAIGERYLYDLQGKEAALRQARHDMLAEMIDTRLIAQAAIRHGLGAGPADVDKALAWIATSQSTTVEDVIADAERLGYAEEVYRAMLEEQVLEGRLLQVEMNQRELDPPGLPEKERTERYADFRVRLKDELRERAYVYSNLPSEVPR